MGTNENGHRYFHQTNHDYLERNAAYVRLDIRSVGVYARLRNLAGGTGDGTSGYMEFGNVRKMNRDQTIDYIKGFTGVNGRKQAECLFSSLVNANLLLVVGKGRLVRIADWDKEQDAPRSSEGLKKRKYRARVECKKYIFEKFLARGISSSIAKRLSEEIIYGEEILPGSNGRFSQSDVEKAIESKVAGLRPAPRPPSDHLISDGSVGGGGHVPYKKGTCPPYTESESETEKEIYISSDSDQNSDQSSDAAGAALNRPGGRGAGRFNPGVIDMRVCVYEGDPVETALRLTCRRKKYDVNLRRRQLVQLAESPHVSNAADSLRTAMAYLKAEYELRLDGDNPITNPASYLTGIIKNMINGTHRP